MSNAGVIRFPKIHNFLSFFENDTVLFVFFSLIFVVPNRIGNDHLFPIHPKRNMLFRVKRAILYFTVATYLFLSGTENGKYHTAFTNGLFNKIPQELKLFQRLHRA